VEWYEVTSEYHKRTLDQCADLMVLAAEWQRELAALWRLEADVNSGAYLQFLTNWGHASYLYATRALKKIGAHKMAEIIDRCQALVDEHFPTEGKSGDELQRLLPNPVISDDGRLVKHAGSVLPDPVLARIYELSAEFMDYPDKVSELGLAHYRLLVEGDVSGPTPHSP
jgi:hypothetical protein